MTFCGKNGRVGQAIDGSAVRLTRIACWIPNASVV